MRGRDKFNKYKWVINFVGGGIKILPKKVRNKLFVRCRRIKGNLGIGIRYVLLKSLAESVGDNVAIFPDVYILHPENLIVGHNVSIQPFSYLECGNVSGIEIGNDVSIAHGVSMIATNHGFSDPTLCIKDQPLTEEKIIIGNDVWFGAKSTVLSGKKVGSHCIIAASAVVTKDVEDRTIVGGVPAKVIRRI